LENGTVLSERRTARFIKKGGFCYNKVMKMSKRRHIKLEYIFNGSTSMDRYRSKITREVNIRIRTSDPNNPMPGFLAGSTIAGIFIYLVTKNPVWTIIMAIFGGIAGALIDTRIGYTS